MKKIFKSLMPVALVIMLLTGCNVNLDVANPNQPDRNRVLATPSDVEALAAGAYNTIYTYEHAYTGVQMMLGTAADNSSCSWGNSAMRDMSWEPRDFAWTNTASYSYRGTTKNCFDRAYAAINAGKTVLDAIENGMEIGVNGADNIRAQAVSLFAQGVGYGDLAAVFDKAYVLENITPGEGAYEDAVDYNLVAAAGLAKLDEAIALCSNTFTIPADWFGQDADLTNEDLKALANTYAARILSYTPRNSTELAAVNWAKVKSYADAGITSDFIVQNDNYATWYHEAGDYLTYQGWGVTDMYVVHLMDPTQPQHWEDDAAFPYPAESTSPIDNRLNTDFEYISSNWLLASRGYYHYSAYRSKRYDVFYVNADGPRNEMLKAENDMLRAEARVYLNDLAGAAAIINDPANSRKARGGMTDVAAVKQDLINAIHHERHVELFVTGMGIQFYEMRKLNLLQKGTPLHLPLPAETLQTFGLAAPYYSYGKTANADGINTSNGGWR